MALSGREKAIILLSLLGGDLSSRILESLPEEFADLIASGVNSLPTPSSDAISGVIEEFSSFMTLPETSARRVIEEKKAPAQEQKRTPYDIIFYSPSKKVAAALSAERPSVTAFILSFFPKVRAVEILSFMGDKDSDIEKEMQSLRKTLLADKIKDVTVNILSQRIERMSS